MPSYLLIGDNKNCEEYISEYIEKESLYEFDVEKFTNKILIEHSRKISHSLSLSTSRKKLIILNGEITIEAQNALLKNIEELSSNFTFMICAPSTNDILPTIISRCFILDLGQDDLEKNEVVYYSIINFIEKKIDSWEVIDMIETSGITSEGLKKLLIQLRFILLNKDLNDEKKIYILCKRLIKYISLVENNNVNKRIVLEKVFLSEL